MPGGGKTVGLILIGAGLIAGILTVAWLGAGLSDDESGLRLTGALFGMSLIFVAVVAPLIGFGIFLFVRGRREARLLVNVERQRKMLGMVEAAGEIRISEIALQTGGTRETVREDLYDLVSKGLFAGYVDWERGVLYARQGLELRERNTCPNCGGELSLAGKGLIRCPYCGAEIFLP
jgi:hypothetical protein